MISLVVKCIPAIALVFLAPNAVSAQSKKKTASPLDQLSAKNIDQRERWNKQPKELVAVLRGHTRSVASIGFSSDGRTLVSSSWDNTIRVWRLKGKAFTATARLNGSPSQIALSPKGTLLATGTPEKPVQIWDLSGRKPKEVRKLAGHQGRPFALAFSPDGKWLASGNSEPLLRVWKITGGEAELWAAFSGDDSPSIGIVSTTFSADNKLLAVSSLAGKRTFRVWDVSGAYMKELEFPEPQAHRTAFSPDGKTLLLAQTDATLNLWNVKDGKFKKRKSMKDHQKIGFPIPIRAVAFSPTGHRLATAGENHEVLLWDPRSGKLLRHWLLPHNVNALAFAPDGRHLATANQDGGIFILRLA